MGYTTYFNGAVEVSPPLSEAEAEYLRRFAGSRRMRTSGGPYFADPGDDAGQATRTDREGTQWAGPHQVLDYNEPPAGQPGLWCNWTPDEAGEHIVWDGGEKFYYAAEWMKYLIDHFLKPGAVGQTTDDAVGRYELSAFTFDHVLNGEIAAEGEDPDDRWILVVKDNVVSVSYGRPMTYGDPVPV